MAYDSNYGKPGSFDQPLNPQPRIGGANLWPIPPRQPEVPIPTPGLPGINPWPIGAAGSGTTGLYGKVQSGSGNTYTVQTFSNGPSKAADSKTVSVTILQIASTEDIPNGTWIGPISTTTDADGNITGWTTVPIWLA